MSINNWSRLAGGKKNNGMQGVSKSKATSTSKPGKGGSKLSQAKNKRSSKKTTGAKAVAYDEARWRAEDDARTLQRASQILEDKKRVAKAKKIAEEQAKVAAEAAASIRQL